MLYSTDKMWLPASTTPAVILTPAVVNSMPVPLTPVVHLELWISSRIFEIILNDANGMIRGLGEDDSWLETEDYKSRDNVPFVRKVGNHRVKQVFMFKIYSFSWRKSIYGCLDLGRAVWETGPPPYGNIALVAVHMHLFVSTVQLLYTVQRRKEEKLIENHAPFPMA